MRYHYMPSDPGHFATNLRREQGTRNLKWDNARGQDVLIVQTPFGRRAEGLMEELCEEMSVVPVQPDGFTELRPGVWFRFVGAADKVRLGGCPINTEASTYTVFGCTVDGNDCRIYAPQDQAMISAYCDIPMEIHVEVTELKRSEGLFRKRLVPTGYFAVSFPSGSSAAYRDGDMAYKAEGLLIPITGRMLDAETVFVKSGRKPEIVSLSSGLQIV